MSNIDEDIEVAKKLPGIINLMSQNILTNLVKIRHLEERIKILEQRNLHSAENNNYWINQNF